MAKIGSLGDFKLPTGGKGNIFNLNDWFGLVLGSAMLLLTFAMGQRVARKVDSIVPRDQSIRPIINQPAQTKTKMYV